MQNFHGDPVVLTQNHVIEELSKAGKSECIFVWDRGDIKLMIIDEDFPIDFTDKVCNIAALSIIKESFVVPINKKDLIPLHKKMQCKSRVIMGRALKLLASKLIKSPAFRLLSMQNNCYYLLCVMAQIL